MQLIKCLLVICLLPISAVGMDTLKVLFVYGSRPASKEEDKWFGGIHGGHVSIRYQEGFASFVPKDGLQIFPKSPINSKFICESGEHFVFDTTESRYLIISIPIDSLKHLKLDSLIKAYLFESPYPYAFFGMRCASASADLLQFAGLIEHVPKHRLWRQYFYPRQLRKILIKKARKNSWPMIYRIGRTSRRWEKDRLHPGR